MTESNEQLGSGTGAGRDVTVIGGGIVGMSCALFLRRDGHNVTVIDPQVAERAASFGNAGLISSSCVTPLGVPGLWRQVPGMLLNRSGPLRINWSYLPQITPWLLRFLAASSRRRVEASAHAMAALSADIMTAHDELAAEAGADDLLRRNGSIKLFRSEAEFAGSALDRELMDHHGVRYEVLDGPGIERMEPNLSGRYGFGIYRPDCVTTVNPGKLVKAYTARFRACGGTVLESEVVRIEDSGSGGRQVVTKSGTHSFDVLVLAAGAWSKPLAQQLGVRLPLDTERGYHLNMKVEPARGPSRLLFLMDLGLVLVPTDEGLRLTSGVEFGGLAAAPNYRRIYRMRDAVGAAFPHLKGEVDRQWMGFRPSFPDSMPVIGPVPGKPWAVLAFGHGHLGLTFGPTTGRLVSDLVAGRNPPIDLTPFRPNRF